MNVMGCLDQAAELLTDAELARRRTLSTCDCCWRRGEGFAPNELTYIHAISGDRCTGHARLCDKCRDAECWPGHCER